MHPSNPTNPPAADALSALKGDLQNRLWPSGPVGSIYGSHAREPGKKAQFDARLQALLDHFGHERLLELALEEHVEMTRGRTPPRTFLGHIDRLQQRMYRELSAWPPAGQDFRPVNASGVSPIAHDFLRALGYDRPASVLVERTLAVLSRLHSDGFSLDEVRAAAELAARMDARGPGLIPYMIGQAPPEPSAHDCIAAEHRESDAQERARWRELGEQFDALPGTERARYIEEARRANPMIARLSVGHRLLHAAAIATFAAARDSAVDRPGTVPSCRPQGPVPRKPSPSAVTIHHPGGHHGSTSQR